MDWYYAVSGERNGPVPEEELMQLAQSGVVTAATLVWRSGMTEWKPFGHVGPGAPPPVPESVPMRYCSGCGKQFPAADLMISGGSSLCSACQPELRSATTVASSPRVQHVQPFSTQPQMVRYAGFWIRFVAYVLDAIIIGVVQGVLFAMLFGGTILNLIRDGMSGQRAPDVLLDALPMAFGVRFGGFVLSLAYFAWCWTQYSATPGKMALGLKVINPDGSPISIGQAIGRYLGMLLSGIILAIGFIMAGFDPEKRALHDRLAGTRVIYVR